MKAKKETKPNINSAQQQQSETETEENEETASETMSEQPDGATKIPHYLPIPPQLQESTQVQQQNYYANPAMHVIS